MAVPLEEPEPSPQPGRRQRKENQKPAAEGVRRRGAVESMDRTYLSAPERALRERYRNSGAGRSRCQITGRPPRTPVPSRRGKEFGERAIHLTQVESPQAMSSERVTTHLSAGPRGTCKTLFRMELRPRNLSEVDTQFR
jgi:hypothetical protein